MKLSIAGRPALGTLAALTILAGCSNGSLSAFTPAGGVAGPAAPGAMQNAHSAKAEGVPPPEDPYRNYSVSWGSGCTEYFYWKKIDGYWSEFSGFQPLGCNYGTTHFSGEVYNVTSSQWFLGATTASENVINVYDKKWKQVGTLTGLSGVPLAITTDSKGNVWATNSPSNVVTKFSAGTSGKTTDYGDGNLSSISYVAVAKNDTLYISGQSATTGALEVDEMTASGVITATPITGAVAGGVAIARNGKTLWVCDEGSGAGGMITAYSLPSFAVLYQSKYSGTNTDIAVTSDGTQLYANNNVASGSQFNTSVAVYNAKNGTLLESLPSGSSTTEAIGIAFGPAVKK
jgi:hypothetical protein